MKASASKINTVYERMDKESATRWRALDGWVLSIPSKLSSILDQIRKDSEIVAQ